MDCTPKPETEALDPAAVADLIDATRRRLERGAHVCRHLRDRSAVVALACAQCPDTVCCALCYHDHTARHAYDLEHRCDACGTTDQHEGLVCITAPLVGTVPYRRDRRTRGALLGVVPVASIGLCLACAEPAGIDASAVAS